MKTIKQLEQGCGCGCSQVWLCWKCKARIEQAWQILQLINTIKHTKYKDEIAMFDDLEMKIKGAR